METYILLATALELKNTQIAKLLLTSYSFNVNNVDENSPLHYAVLNDDVEIIKMFLDEGANAENFNGNTALHNAVENMKTEIIAAADSSSKEIMNLPSSRGATVVENRNDAAISSHIAADTGKHCPPLHLAVDKGNEEITKLLLSKGANVNAKGKHDTTALHIATEKGHLKIVQLLLKHGADVNCRANVNAKGDTGATSLHIATEKGYLQIVENLLNAGADVNTTRGTYTPLRLAVENQHEQIVTLLLNKGANVNETGITCLRIATMKQNLTIIEHLLKHGVDVNSGRSTWSYTPLQRAADIGDEEITELFLSKGANVNAKARSGRTALHIATDKGHSKIVELLLKHGASVNSAYTSRTCLEGYTSLHVAAEKGYARITELLLSKGANVNAKARHDTTALHIATEKGHSQVVQLLLKHGADVNSVYTSTFRKGYTLLHFAAEAGNEEITRLLLRNGADVNAKEKHDLSAFGKGPSHNSIDKCFSHQRFHSRFRFRDGYTPLHLAVENGHKEVVNLLLECGADVDDEDKDSQSILLLAVVKGSSTIVEHILKHRPDLNNRRNSSVFDFAVNRCGTEYDKIIENLLRYGFTVNPTGANDLMYAAIINKHTKVFEELLKRGADVNMLCSAGFGQWYRPLHVAIKHRREAEAELLIRHGADVNDVDKAGSPPILYAIENNDLRMTKLLLSNEANVKDPELLYHAVMKGHGEIVEVLLQHGADAKSRRMPLHFNILNNAEEANANTRIEDSKTMLHTAIEKGCAKVVEALLEYDADVNATYEDMTPLHFAAIKGNAEIVEILLNKGANIIAEGIRAENVLLHAIDRGDTKVVELLLDCSAKVDTTIECDLWSPLHMAVNKRCSDMVKVLLKFGANVDFPDTRGSTALHCATMNGLEDIVAILLEHGADVTIMNEYECLALDFAMESIKEFAYFDEESYIHDDPNIANYVNIAEILKRHIVKIKAANLHVVNEHMLSISSDDEEQSNFLNESNEAIARVYSKKVREENRLARYKFQDECEKEVASMKREKFINTYITVYDILQKDESRLATYAKNENIVKAFESGDYKEKFPIYASMINRNFRNGENRKVFLERGKTIFYSIFKNFPELPRVCTEQIFSYLNDGDIRVLIGDCKLIRLC